METYARVIKRIHACGLAVQAGIVFRFDHDTETIFDETLDFLELAGYKHANQHFYSPRSIYQRLARSPVGLLWTLSLNLAYMSAFQYYAHKERVPKIRLNMSF